MRHTLRLGELPIQVVRKDIRNVHLSVHPPAGRVTIAAPRHVSLAAIRAYAITRLGWIRRQQKKLQEQERETRREYLDRESHYLWGRRYLLKVLEKDEAPRVTLKGSQMVLRVRPGTTAARRHELVEDWYRSQVREALPVLLRKWEKRFGVEVKKVHLQRMRTKWGSCNAPRRTIRLNTDLARKPRPCLEYIVVHEMAHFVVRHHNEHFIKLMDRHLPTWRQVRHLLNSTPLAHVDWEY